MEAVQTCSTAKQAPMEIERKFIPKQLPPDLAQYPYHEIEQGYLCTSPTAPTSKSRRHFNHKAQIPDPA